MDHRRVPLRVERQCALVENVVTGFKDGVGYDSAKLLASVRGKVGRQ